MASSASLETLVSCGRTGPSAAPKTLAFSIDRIMSKGPEHKGRAEERAEEKKLLGLCSPIPCMIPLQPFSYDLQAKALMNYSELWRASLRGTFCCSSATQCKGSCGVCAKADAGRTPGARLVKPQVIHQAVTVPRGGSLYYLNYLDSAYQQSELLAGHWFTSPQGQASLSAHHRLMLLENAKLAGAGADKLPTPQYPHKEHLPGQLDQIVKENHGPSADKSLAKTHIKLGGSGNSAADGKPKNFTCEVCGKVRESLIRFFFKSVLKYCKLLVCLLRLKIDSNPSVYSLIKDNCMIIIIIIFTF